MMWRNWLSGLLGQARTGGALLAMVLVVAACGGDEPTGKGVAEGCLINSDCASPLVCAFRKCHQACTTSRDCQMGQRCVASDKPTYVCQLDDERNCSFNSDCPITQTCGVDSQCRDQCAADRDCLGGQVCAGSTCADISELQDGGLPVVAPEGGKVAAAGQPCLYTSECPEPLVCRDNVCANACAATSDCPPGSDCVDNRCVSDAVKPIGPEGGVAVASSGRVKLTVPPGSLKTPVAIVILPLDAWPAGALGPAFEIVPSGTVFNPSATLTFTYEPGDIGAVAPTDLHLAQAVGPKWTALMSSLDPAAHTVSASIGHLSVYGMLGPDQPPDASTPIDASVGGSDAATDAQQTAFDGGSSTDTGADQSVGVDAGLEASSCNVVPTNIGAPCSTDCDCAGIVGLVGVCSNGAYPLGSIDPTPVCTATSGATAATVPSVATCDNGYGVALGTGAPDQAGCYPSCYIDALGSHGCKGNDACMYVGFTGGAEPTVWGYCWGGCTADLDCPSGEKCQIDLGYCLKPAATYVPSKPIGSPCSASDNNVNCNCGGRSGGLIGSICTSACAVGGSTCPQGFTCDPMVPVVDPFSGRTLLTDVGASGTWGNCAKNCIGDAECTVPGTCVLHAGMTQKTCDNGPQFVPDGGGPAIDAGKQSSPDSGVTSSCDTQCISGDGCCPYSCTQQNDSDCAGGAWNMIKWQPAVDYSNVDSGYCNDVYIYGITPNSNYAFTTCSPDAVSVATGDPVIVSIVDQFGEQYLLAAEDSCNDPGSIPSLLGWNCQNVAGQLTMTCSQSGNGVATGPGGANYFDVKICASSPAGAGAASLYVFYNAPTPPNPG